MDFSHIVPRYLKRVPPEGWKNTWYGYFQMEKVISEEKKRRDEKTHKLPQSHQRELIRGESFLEQQVFLNIVNSLEGHVDMFELGAGRGDWCLALAGIIDFGLIDTKATSYRCLAIEAEPSHYEWTKEHFEKQEINAIAVHGALWSSVGECSFYSKENPASNYGQCVRDDGNIKVPSFTVDSLMRKYQFDKLDLIHADIQGAEYEMVLGSIKALEERKVKYWMIGTHLPDLNDRITDFMRPYGYRVLYSVTCASGVHESPFGKISVPVDGLLVLEAHA